VHWNRNCRNSPSLREEAGYGPPYALSRLKRERLIKRFEKVLRG
jgi:hypothetical protein